MELMLHLLAQLLLVVRLPERPDRRPHVEEHGASPQRVRELATGGHSLIGARRAVRCDDDRPLACGFHGAIVLLQRRPA